MRSLVVFTVKFNMLKNIFFFSSRRRHTRFKCDWSSDVCSSDLFLLSLQAKALDEKSEAETEASRPVAAASGKLILSLLFLIGLVSLAIEDVWLRQFTPYMGTQVYAFSLLLGCYLAGTFMGSQIYRK